MSADDDWHGVGQTMTPSEFEAMEADWRAWHAGAIPEWIMPRQSLSFERGFAAGLAHARAECAAHLESRADELFGLSYACSFAAEAMRKEAAKMRAKQ